MPASPESSAARHAEAQVVAVDGRRFLIETADGEARSSFTRDRVGPIVCGDRVQVRIASSEEAVIEAVLPRTSLLRRSDRKREKAIAANVDVVLLVLAVVPRTTEDFIDRVLASAEHAGIEAVLVLNKADLDTDGTSAASLEAYRALGYRTLTMSAVESAAPIRPLLAGRSTVLLGRSGVGKSTLLNALLPGADARTAAISRSEGGRHTTTRARLYRLDSSSALIDAPGLQEFGLQHIPLRALAETFREFRPMLGRCRFGDCLHTGELGCALEEAARRGTIAPVRLLSYRRILATLDADPLLS